MRCALAEPTMVDRGTKAADGPSPLALAKGAVYPCDLLWAAVLAPVDLSSAHRAVDQLSQRGEPCSHSRHGDGWLPGLITMAPR